MSRQKRHLKDDDIKNTTTKQVLEPLGIFWERVRAGSCVVQTYRILYTACCCCCCDDDDDNNARGSIKTSPRETCVCVSKYRHHHKHKHVADIWVIIIIMKIKIIINGRGDRIRNTNRSHLSVHNMYVVIMSTLHQHRH